MFSIRNRLIHFITVIEDELCFGLYENEFVKLSCMCSTCFRSIVGAGDEKPNGVLSGILHTASIGGKDVLVDDHVCGNKSPGEGGRGVEDDRGVLGSDTSYDDEEYEDDGGEELDDMFATSRACKEVLNERNV